MVNGPYRRSEHIGPKQESTVGRKNEKVKWSLIEQLHDSFWHPEHEARQRLDNSFQVKTPKLHVSISSDAMRLNRLVLSATE